MIRGWADVGVPFRNDGGADGNNVGVAWVPENIDPVNVTRSYSRTAYYDPVAQRSNLHLLVRHYVSTLDISQKTVGGVNIVSRETNGTVRARARKEVILAAGAVHTPQILQLSGIGPASLLESLNIDVVEDLPGVGANFQDHPSFFLSYQCKSIRRLSPFPP